MIVLPADILFAALMGWACASLASRRLRGWRWLAAVVSLAALGVTLTYAWFVVSGAPIGALAIGWVSAP